jgi:hypothetical protein
MDQERRPESYYEWWKITLHIDYPTRSERGVKNTIICTVMRGDIGLYENFEKYAKVQANEVQSTIHITVLVVLLGGFDSPKNRDREVLGLEETAA